MCVRERERERESIKVCLPRPQCYPVCIVNVSPDRTFSVDPAAVWAIFRSNQWSTTGLSKAVVCTVLSMEKCI